MDPATTIAIDVTHDGRTGRVELTVGEWKDNFIEISFRDSLCRNSGVIRFNAANGGIMVESLHPYTGTLADNTPFNEYFGAIARTFANAYTFGWSPAPESMITYDANYHASNQYIQGDPLEVSIKQVQAKIIEALAGREKCVVAGCSNGELVRQCRAIGIDAWGFDVIPNIQEIAFPEVRDKLRVGSLTEIPYNVTDGFETLVAIDVLEHIPERDVPRMVQQWLELGVRRLILLINLNQFWFPGHVTLRPISWWESQFRTHFQLVSTTSRFEHLPIVYSNGGLYNQRWTLWGRRAAGGSK